MVSPEECRERFADDPTIFDTVELLRRIPPWHFVWDENEGLHRPSSSAFEHDRDGDPMSVYRSDVIEEEGDDPKRVMKGHSRFGLVSLASGFVRKKRQTVNPDPLRRRVFPCEGVRSQDKGNPQVVRTTVRVGDPASSVTGRGRHLIARRRQLSRVRLGAPSDPPGARDYWGSFGRGELPDWSPARRQGASGAP